MRKDEYRSYLRSARWQENRTLAIERSGGFCEFCGAFVAAVHHVTYPKNLGTEHPDSLIAVCARCHALSHGIKPMQTLPSLLRVEPIEAVTPSGRKWHALSGDIGNADEPSLWASAEAWARVFCWPKEIIGHFDSLLLAQQGSNPGCVALFENKKVYRYHVVDDAVQFFHYVYRKKGAQTYELQGLPRHVIENLVYTNAHINEFRRWCKDQNERSIIERIRGRERNAIPSDATSLAAAIAEAIAPRFVAIEKKTLDHDIVITEIKSAVPALRDHTQCVSIKQAIREVGLDGSEMPRAPQTRLTLEQLVAKELIAEAAEQGPKVITRLEGSSIDRQVNTYRRGAIYAAIRRIKG